MKTYILFLFFAILRLSIAGQSIQWFDSISYSSNNLPAGIVGDNAGNTYVAGNYYPAYHDYSNPYGIFISKYDSLGNIVWLDTTNMRASINGLAIDNSDNLYLAAYSQHGGSIKFGSYSFVTVVGTAQFYLVKYNSTGSVTFARQINNVSPKGIITDSNGFVYCYGDVSAATAFDSFSLGTGNYIAKFDSLGNCILAFSTASEIGNVAVDNAGNIFVTDRNGSSAPDNIKKFSNTGSLLWMQNLGASGSVYSDPDGFLYITGGFYSSSITLGTSTLTNPFIAGSGIPAQWFIAKMDQNGNYLWATTPADSVSLLGFHLNGNNIYLTGYTGWGAGELYDHKLYLMTYDTSGNFLSETKFMSNYSGTFLIRQGQSIYLAGAQSNLNYYDAFFMKIAENTIPVNIEETESDSYLNVYPNPSPGTFQISFSSSEKTYVLINIINSRGQNIYRAIIQKAQGDFNREIDLSKQSKGVYLIEIIAGKAREVKKIIIE